MDGAEAKNDKGIDVFAVRSLLFLPASNPRAVEKARELGADLVILDLEDAVKPADKDAARGAAVEAVASSWPVPVAVRVNGTGTEWHERDVEAVRRSDADLVVLPRASSPEEVRAFARAIGKPVLAMIETAAGVLASAAIARETLGLIAGTNDLRADLRLPLDASREPISTALQLIVLAGRAAGVAVFDGVFNNLQDANGFLSEAEEGRRLGFDGKSLIHPNQIALANEVFGPTADEVAAARAIVAVFERPENADKGAVAVDGRMVERLHAEMARRVLDLAEAIERRERG
jgi:citrate lyase subunit beta/citryl-CoA lyase